MANPTRHRGKASLRFEQAAIGMAAGTFIFAIALALRFLTRALDLATVGVAVGYALGASLLLLFLVWLLALAYSAVTNERSFAVAFFMKAHRWHVLAPDEAEDRWRSMHMLPAGGALIDAFWCRDCPTLLLACLGPDEAPYALVPATGSRHSVAWLAGLFLGSTLDIETARRSRAWFVFQRQGCRWQPMSRQRLAEELDKRGQPVRAEDVEDCWSCRDCPAVRLDIIGADGQSFMMLTGAPLRPLTEWYVGLIAAGGSALLTPAGKQVLPRPQDSKPA
jgi:hypothetical protein